MNIIIEQVGYHPGDSLAYVNYESSFPVYIVYLKHTDAHVYMHFPGLSQKRTQRGVSTNSTLQDNLL